MRIRNTAILCLCALVMIAGCGDDSTDTPVGAITANGAFKDANVEGVTFRSGDESGVTGANGRFRYEVGVNVTLSVGGVTLGTAGGKPVVTPVDLVANGNTGMTRVQNIARFLLMLDLDGDPDNGITISPAVQAVAAGWSQVDFDTNDLPTELASIISDANTADATTHTLPDAPTAQAHLEATLLCTSSGVYRGTFSGTESGPLAVALDATTGLFNGFLIAPGNTLFALAGSNPVDFEQQGDFSGTFGSTGTFAGQLTGPTSVGGTWTDTPENGTFAANLVAASSSAEYRFTATFIGDAVGLMSFDVDTAGNVSGSALTMWAPDGTTDELITFTGGTVTGTTLNIVMMEGGQVAATLTGTMDRAAGTVSGTWVDSEGAGGTFAGTGCKLN